MSQVTEVTPEQFTQEVIEHSGKVLVDFYAQWCGPCKMIAPVLDQITDKYDDLKVVKVDADHAQELMAHYSVRGIPTLLLIDKGEVVDRKVGAASLQQIDDFVNMK